MFIVMIIYAVRKTEFYKRGANFTHVLLSFILLIIVLTQLIIGNGLPNLHQQMNDNDYYWIFKGKTSQLSFPG